MIRDKSGISRGEIFDPSVIFRQPHRRGLKSPEAVEAGYALGRLRLHGLLNEQQVRSGNEFALVVYAYARTIGIPMGSPRSGSMSECIATGFYAWEGDRVEIDHDEVAKRVKRVKGRYNDCYEVLSDLGRMHGRGNKILAVMKEICIEERESSLLDDAVKLGDLRLGLNAVHKVLFERK